MQRPFVNMNGTARDALVSQQLAIINAAHELLAKLAAATPHGRDYLDEVALKNAQDDHARHVAAVRQLKTERMLLGLDLTEGKA